MLPRKFQQTSMASSAHQNLFRRLKKPNSSCTFPLPLR